MCPDSTRWALPSRPATGGPLLVSPDGGGSWKQISNTGGEPQALVAADRKTLYALLLDGTVKRTADGGRTWGTHVSPA